MSDYIESDLLDDETLSEWRRRTSPPRRPRLTTRLKRRLRGNRCETPADVRGAGTCLRGTPGCPVPHPYTTSLPTIGHRP